VWEDKRAAIETALNLNIVKIKYDMGKSRVLLYAVPAAPNLPQDKYLSPKDFVLVMGEGLLGPVTVELNTIPHILIGGSAGSGKSVLLKLLLMQDARKGTVVCIADFKGGVNFPPIWQEKCQMCFGEDELIPMLEMLTAVPKSRRALFKSAGCRNTKATEEHLPRYIFACEEMAELMSKTGRGNKVKPQMG
jgi:S-DNA-T family DNA segregation ATPase FtsK/SpoIIIE